MSTETYCCDEYSYLIKDERIEFGKTNDGVIISMLWTSRDPTGGDWEPETIVLNFCPNCGTRLHSEYVRGNDSPI